LIVASDVDIRDDITNLIISDDIPDEPSFKAYIEAKVYDKEGHMVQHHRQPMRSLTQYFLALMSAILVGTFQSPSTANAQPLLTSILGLPSTISNSVGCAGINWDFTIQVGSGSQPFSVTLNSLAAPIANGSGNGQLLYTGWNVTYSEATYYYTITTYNVTSSTITVTEIGLVGTIGVSCGGCSVSPPTFLLSYDTFSSPISIPSNGLATFEITISFSG
jgi:hypothetical protein